MKNEKNVVTAQTVTVREKITSIDAHERRTVVMVVTPENGIDAAIGPFAWPLVCDINEGDSFSWDGEDLRTLKLVSTGKNAIPRRIQTLPYAELQAELETRDSVLRMFMENVSIPEITNILGLTMTRTIDILIDLSAADKVDLIPWIERNINSKSLYKGVEYFTKVSRPSFEEAHMTIGLDYSTLKFCKVYAEQVQAGRGN